MPSTQEIKRRIKSVNSTRQITKAMELVSATKMRKSQEIALLSRPYAVEALRILGEMARRTAYKPELMKKRLVKNTAVVLISADRGLAGAFNTNVFRAFEKYFGTHLNSPHYSFISIGKKAEDYLLRKSITPRKSFKDFGDYVAGEETKPLSDLLINGFLNNNWDRVITIGTHFRTTLRQEVLIRNVLPIDYEKMIETVRSITPEYGRFAEVGKGETGFEKYFEYLVEPSPKTVLDALAPHLLGIEIYHIILEANASEHSARMVAMKNASENAKDLGDELNLEFNKTRQAAITREISEIVGGSEALNG